MKFLPRDIAEDYNTIVLFYIPSIQVSPVPFAIISLASFTLDELG